MRLMFFAFIALCAVGCGCNDLPEEEYPTGPPPTFPDDGRPKPQPQKMEGGRSNRKPGAPAESGNE